jgi:hypothetical protein
MSGTIQEYKEMVVSYLRDLEYSQSQGNVAKQRQVEETEDNALLRKWFWIGGIAGGILCFAVLPFVFNLMGMIIPHLLMQLLWIPLSGLQGIVGIILILAIVLTVKK